MLIFSSSTPRSTPRFHCLHHCRCAQMDPVECARTPSMMLEGDSHAPLPSHVRQRLPAPPCLTTIPYAPCSAHLAVLCADVTPGRTVGDPDAPVGRASPAVSPGQAGIWSGDGKSRGGTRDCVHLQANRRPPCRQVAFIQEGGGGKCHDHPQECPGTSFSKERETAQRKGYLTGSRGGLRSAKNQLHSPDLPGAPNRGLAVGTGERRDGEQTSFQCDLTVQGIASLLHEATVC